MTEQLAIQFQRVVKYGRRKTIGPLDIDIPSGYIVALVGPNGSGKSTIFQMLLQIIKPNEGEIKWFGQSYPGGLPVEIRQRIAYVPEGPDSEENFMTPEVAAEFRSHWYPTWDQRVFEELITRFEVPRKERLNRMSKGERRKYEIAAALASRPKLLLLDEPSSGLDPFAWRSMIDELREYMDGEDITIIMSTHIVEEVRRLADYIILIHQGQTLGMVEKDLLYGSWKEIWIRGEFTNTKQYPEVIFSQQDGPSISKLIVRDSGEHESNAYFREFQIIRSRALDLEEILDLWMKGFNPVK